MTLAGTLRPVAVCNFDENGVRKLMPVSEREMMRAELFLRRVLSADRLERGRFALIISTLMDAPYVIPIERVLTSNGMITTNCEASPYDGSRIESTIRRFDVAMVFGVSALVLDAIASAGFDPAKLFEGKIVWACGEGFERLAGVPGVDLRRFESIGPVFAFEGRHGGGLHVDGREWLLEPDGEVTYVTSRLDRATPFERLKINRKLTISPDPCVGGAFGPRVLL